MKATFRLDFREFKAFYRLRPFKGPFKAFYSCQFAWMSPFSSLFCAQNRGLEPFRTRLDLLEVSPRLSHRSLNLSPFMAVATYISHPKCLPKGVG